jgi:hypothetical protein
MPMKMVSVVTVRLFVNQSLQRYSKDKASDGKTEEEIKAIINRRGSGN